LNSFREFALHKAIYWSNFAAKWIDQENPELERCIVYYEDLTSHAAQEMEKVVKFFAPEHEPDRELIVDIVNRVAAQSVTKEREIWQEGGRVFRTAAGLKTSDTTILSFSSTLRRKPGFSDWGRRNQLCGRV